MKSLKYLSITLVSLFLLYAVAGFFLVPYLITDYLPIKVKDELGIRTTFKKASFNPFTFSLNINQTAILTEKNEPIVTIKDFNTKLKVSKLIFKNIYLENVTFLEPKVNAIINKKGEFNFFNLLKIDNKDTKKTSEKSSWTFDIEDLSIKKGGVTFKDEKYEKPFIMEFEPINYQAQNIGTSKDSNGLQKLSTESTSVNNIIIDGNMTMNPFSAIGLVNIKGLKLEKVWNYSVGNGNFYPKKSIADISFNYQIETTKKGLKLFFNALKITLQNTELFEKNQKFASIKTVDISNADILANIEKDKNFIKITNGILNLEEIDMVPSKNIPLVGSIKSANLKNILFDYDIKSGTIKNAIESTTIDYATTHLSDSLTPFGGNFNNLAFNNFTLELPKTKSFFISLKDASLTNASISNKKQKKPFTTIETLKLNSIALTNDSFNCDALLLNGMKLSTSLEKDGSLDFLQGVTEHNTTKDVNSSSSFRYLLKTFEAKNTSIDFQDKSIQKPFTKKFNISILKLTNISSKKDEKITLSLQAKAQALPLLSFNGTVKQNPLHINGKYKIKHNNLSHFQNYLNEISNVLIKQGTLETSGSISLKINDILNLNLQSNSKLRNVHFRKKDNSPLVSWKSLEIQKLKYNHAKERLNIGNIVLQNPKTKFIVQENGKNNFNNLVKARGEKSKKNTKSNLKLTIYGLKLENGDVSIQDNSLVTPATIDISKIAVNSSNFKNRSSKLLNFKGQAVINKSGYLSLEGSLDPNDMKKNTHFSIVTKNISIPKIDGYTKTYLGRVTKEGSIVAKMTQKIEKGQLRGENHIILEKFVLGESVQSKKALTLPLDTALMLLRDGNGDVTLDIPVSGDMNDPKFSYGSVIVTAFTNIITGIVAAPFNILSGVLDIVGIEAEKLKTVDFEPSNTDIIASEMDKIKKYAMILEKKKKLKLTIACGYNEKLDIKGDIAKEDLQELANKRATTIKKALINAGVKTERIIIKNIKQTDSKDNHWVNCEIGIEQ